MKEISKRQRRLEAKRQETSISPKFVKIDLLAAKYVPPGMTRAYRNNRFTVMVYDYTPTTHGVCTKALIQSHFDKPIEKHWSTIQQIKNEIFGEDVTAIEYYPAERNLIDHHNIYWIWIFPDGVLPSPLMPSDDSKENSRK